MNIEELEKAVNDFKPSDDPKADVEKLSTQLKEAMTYIKKLQKRLGEKSGNTSSNLIARNEARTLGRTMGR